MRDNASVKGISLGILYSLEACCISSFVECGVTMSVFFSSSTVMSGLEPR